MRLLFSLVLLTAVALPAQGDVARTATGLWREGPAPQMLCGGGPDYRVEFAPDGAAFVPALPDAPRLFPLRLSFVSLARGADIRASGRPVAPRSRADSVWYERGPGVVERYQLGSAGVEQSFVLARRPSGRGDVVVRQQLATDLVPETTGECSAGLRFVAPGGHGGVEIGEAVAVDARGARFAMTMQFDGAWLELRLDAAAVDAAAYPLVLDPPIGTARSLTANDEQAPDVAWNEPARRYLVVWHRQLSSTVTEVFGQLLDDRALPVSPMLAMSTGNGVAMFPTVASYGIRDQFCVVWQEAPTLLGTFNLQSRLVEATNGALSQDVPVTFDTSVSNLAPDLAATPGRGDDRIMLVFQKSGQGIFARAGRVSATGEPEWVLVTPLGTGGVRPAISRSSGSADVHVVAWEVPTAGFRSGSSIQAVPISGTGARLSSAITVSSAISTRSPRRRAPDVDGDGQNFLVVFEIEEATGAGIYDVHCRPIHWDGSALSATAAALPVENDSGNDESNPTVGYLAGQFLVGFADDATTYDVILRTLKLDGTTCGARAHLANPFTHDRHPAIATQLGSADDALCVFVQDALLPLLPSGIGVQLFEAYVGGAATSLGGACGNGGSTIANGVFAAGNSAFRLELRGSDPTAFSAVLMLGLQGAPLSCGSCAIVTSVLNIGLPVTGGAAGLAIPLPCTLQSAAGAVMEAQWLTLGTSQSPCPLLAGLSFSDRLLLTLGQ